MSTALYIPEKGHGKCDCTALLKLLQTQCRLQIDKSDTFTGLANDTCHPADEKARIQGQSYHDRHLYKQKIIKTYGYIDEPLFKTNKNKKQANKCFWSW